MEHVIAGQTVSKELRERVRRLRREMTVAERVLWSELRGHRLENRHFRRQQVIGGYIVDFYCDAARLVVEVDGPVHERQFEYDAVRDQILSAHGVNVLRVTNDEVLGNLAGVLERIAERVTPTPPLRGEG